MSGESVNGIEIELLQRNKIFIMKKVIMPLACVMAIVSIASCNETSSTSSSTDSLKAADGSTTASPMSADGATKTSYVDLYSGSAVEVRKDTATGHYINIQTNEPLEYYVDPSTADTFDIAGRIVNNAIAKGPDGKYILDESKIKTADGKIKVQGDGDIKIKDGDIKVKLETNGDIKMKSGDSKEKIKGDKYKSKDESGKVKVEDGETKVKN